MAWLHFLAQLPLVSWEQERKRKGRCSTRRKLCRATVHVPAIEAVQGIQHPAPNPNLTVDTVQSPLAQQLTSLSSQVASLNTKFDAAISLGSGGGFINSSSTTSTSAVGPVVHTLEDQSLSTIPKTFEILNKTNVMDAWRMWWCGSRRCGEGKDQSVRPFRDINIEHFIFTVKSKRNRRSWLVWKNVMDYLISKLDELKDKKIYDWSATDPVAAQTLMYVARLVPSAPSKEGARKRQILPSTNSVGTVRKNVSLRGLQWRRWSDVSHAESHVVC